MDSINSMIEASDISMQINLKNRLESLEANQNFGRNGRVKSHIELKKSPRKDRYG